MFLTNDVRSWEIAWSFKDHGKNYNAVHHSEHPAGFRWLHESFGTNWRLTEMQSATGRVLLRKLPWMVEQRRRNAAILTQEFSQIPGLRVVSPRAGVCPSYYKYYVYLRKECLGDGWDRTAFRRPSKQKAFPVSQEAAARSIWKKHFLPNCARQSRFQWLESLGEQV